MLINNIEKLAIAISEIDGGCDNCVASFLRDFIPLLEEHDKDLILSKIEVLGEKLSPDHVKKLKSIK